MTLNFLAKCADTNSWYSRSLHPPAVDVQLLKRLEIVRHFQFKKAAGQILLETSQLLAAREDSTLSLRDVGRVSAIYDTRSLR